MSCSSCKIKIDRHEEKLACRGTCGKLFHSKCINSTEKSNYCCETCKLETAIGPIVKNCLKDLEKQLKSIDDKFKILEDSQAFISNQYDDLDIKINTILSLQTKVNVLEATLNEKDLRIRQLEQRLAKQEQYSRRNQLEIRQADQKENENVEDLVISIAKKLDVNLMKTDIEAAHRLKSAPGKTPAIIVQTSSRKMRDQILNQKKKIITNNDIFGNGSGRIYIGESLCPYYKNLLWKAKCTAKITDFKYVWWNGKGVMMRKEDNSKPINIESEEVLLKMGYKETM